MHLLTWVLVGAALGWGTGKILKGQGYGPLMDALMGVAGAVVGGLLISSRGWAGFGGFNLTTVVAMTGAVTATLLAGFANGRRLYARQL